MSQLTHRRLRLPINTAGYDAPRDQMTGRDARIMRGADYRFEIGAFFGAPSESSLISDVSNWAMVKLEIKPLGEDGAAPDPSVQPLVSKITNELNSALTWEQWNTSRDNQHAVITATKGEMAVAPAGKCWLVVSAFTIDDPSQLIPLLSGPVEVVEDGYQDGGTPPAPLSSYYTSDEVDALMGPDRNLNYLGPWDASGGVLPDTTGRAVKDFYLVSVEGVIDSENYYLTDKIVFNGETWDHLPSNAQYAAEAGAAKTGAETARDIAVQNATDSGIARTAAQQAQAEAEAARDAAAQSATASGNSAADSLAAKNLALIAQGAAEDAKVAAQAARDAAQQAQANAEAAQAAAAQSANDANLAKIAAQTAQAAAEAARDAAAAYAAAAAASAAAAVASQIAALASQVAAATSETNAAASAVQAAQAIAQAFKGGVAGASVPATSALAGDTYRITSAGTSQSKTWAIGDAAIYNGTSGSWTQLTGFYLSTAYAESLSGYRSSPGYVFSDGATSNRAAIQTCGTRMNLAGAAKASWVGWVDVPASTPSSDVALFQLFSAPTMLAVGNTNFLWAAFDNSNGFKVWQGGATSGITNRIQRKHTTFRTLYSGQRIWLEIRFTQGTTAPVIRVNGVDISSSFVDDNSGTVIWLDNGLVATYCSSLVNYPAGSASLGCWINAWLTDAESEAWRTTGRAPAWVAAGGSQVNLQTNSSFETYTGTQDDGTTDVFPGWAVVSTDGVNESVSAGRTGSAVKMTRTGSTGSNNQRLYTNALTVGIGWYYVEVWTKGDGTNSLRVEAFQAGYGLVLNSVMTGLSSTSWQKYTVSFYCPISASLQFTLANGGGVGSVVYVDDFSIIQLGALSLPLIQRGAVIGDATDRGDNPARLLGMTQVSDRTLTEWEVPFSYTGSPIQLLGGAVIGGRSYRIDSITGTSGASVNLSLGTSSGGTQVVNAQAVNGSFDIATFASRILAAGSSLYLACSGTASGTIKFKGSPLY